MSANIPPVDITLALEQGYGVTTRLSTRCTEMGDLSITDVDIDIVYVPMLLHKGAADTIFSPHGVLHVEPRLYTFHLKSFHDEVNGLLRFYSRSGKLTIELALAKRNGLYYSNMSSTLLDSVHRFDPSGIRGAA